MQLTEEGRLDIGAPVARYIPEFAEMTVGVERKEANRTMTVQDLLRHTSGLTCAFGDSPVHMICATPTSRRKTKPTPSLSASAEDLTLDHLDDVAEHVCRHRVFPGRDRFE